MLDVVSQRFEDNGRPLPRHRLALPQSLYEGRFSLREAICQLLRRTVLVARLTDANGADVLPPLYDAKFIYCDEGEARVAGLELEELNTRFAAQTWHVRFAGCTAQ